MSQTDGRELAKLKYHLRTQRAYERRMQDIDWIYDVLNPTVDAYKNGDLILEASNPFEITEGEDELQD